MCTVVAIKGRHPRFPLVVAANRDEFYARPTSGPRLVHDAPRAVAGVDEQGGGTWMGANERGLFVALTNQRQYAGADPAKRSRGAVVLDALAQPDVAGVDGLLEALDARDYNAFNLFYGDAATLRVAYARTARPEVRVSTLAEGIWVLPNDEIGSPEFPKTHRAIELVEPFVERPWPALRDRLVAALGDHAEPPLERVPEPPEGSHFDRAMLQRLQALCIHTPTYGTRSATVLALEPGRVAHYLYADGAPCRTPFVEVGGLLR